MKTQINFFQGSSSVIKNGTNLIVPFIIDHQSQAILIHNDHEWVKKTNVWKSFCDQDPHQMKEGDTYIKSLDTLKPDFINIIFIKGTGRNVNELMNNILLLFTMNHIVHIQLPVFWVGYVQKIPETVQQVIGTITRFGHTLHDKNILLEIALAVPDSSHADEVLQVLKDNNIQQLMHWNAEKQIME